MKCARVAPRMGGAIAPHTRGFHPKEPEMRAGGFRLGLGGGLRPPNTTPTTQHPEPDNQNATANRDGNNGNNCNNNSSSNDNDYDDNEDDTNNNRTQ